MSSAGLLTAAGLVFLASGLLFPAVDLLLTVVDLLLTVVDLFEAPERSTGSSPSLLGVLSSREDLISAVFSEVAVCSLIGSDTVGLRGCGRALAYLAASRSSAACCPHCVFVYGLWPL